MIPLKCRKTFRTCFGERTRCLQPGYSKRIGNNHSRDLAIARQWFAFGRQPGGLRNPALIAKLDDKPLVRNDRIVAYKFLNQHCALASALESILLVLAPKLVLRHNRAEAADIDLRSVCCW